MKKINKLYNIINKENIILEEFNFSNSIDGIYYFSKGMPPIIGINKSIISNSKKYISTLAEEIGHHFTCVGNLTSEQPTYREKLYREKQELMAKRWAANVLISDEDFSNALYNPISTINDFSEYFNVTEEIVNYKILNITYDKDKYNKIKNDFKKYDFKYNICNI